jgi:hypothetical protein
MMLNKTEEKLSITAEVNKVPQRPVRPHFKSHGKTDLPKIPGFRVSIKRITDLDGHPTGDVDYAIQEGWMPVLAKELGFDKRIINPLAPDESVKVNLGRGEVGIAMKIYEKWDKEIIEENIARNNSILDTKSKEIDKQTDSDLIESQGRINYKK